MRLDKFLVDMGLGTRSQVKKLLKQKQIQVNGETITSANTQINEQVDQVTYGKKQLVYERFVYYLMNKPSGVITATHDSTHQTVLDLVADQDKRKGLFPVGRLDKDTTGLLLLTDNGDLAHAMLSPKKHVDKIYEAKVEGLMTSDDVKRFDTGMMFKDFTTKPAKLEIVSYDEKTQTSIVRIQLTEGKYHQVKRMVAACGKKVIALHRLSMGPLILSKDLRLGAYRRLTDQEIEALDIFDIPLN